MLQQVSIDFKASLVVVLRFLQPPLLTLALLLLAAMLSSPPVTPFEFVLLVASPHLLRNLTVHSAFCI